MRDAFYFLEPAELPIFSYLGLFFAIRRAVCNLTYVYFWPAGRLGRIQPEI